MKSDDLMPLAGWVLPGPPRHAGNSHPGKGEQVVFSAG